MENQINQLKRDLSVHEGILYCYKDDAPIIFIDNDEDPSKLAKACYDAGYNAALKEVLRLEGGYKTLNHDELVRYKEGFKPITPGPKKYN